jgi:hypothetical protein
MSEEKKHPAPIRKQKVRVTIIKEIEIELTPALLGDMTEAEYLESFRSGLWYIEGMDDVVKYAARMAALHGGGYQHDGLGLLDTVHTTYPRVPDVKFREIDEETETEFFD